MTKKNISIALQLSNYNNVTNVFIGSKLNSYGYKISNQAKHYTLDVAP